MATRPRTPANDGDTSAAALLPAGLRDVLPPRAEWEAQASENLIASFAAQGYVRVKPPLIEFEETLLAGSGQDLAGQMFRVMDPVSQRMMGLRTDITLQVARIAASRMKDSARPLRLAYAFPIQYQDEEVGIQGQPGYIPKDRIQRIQFQIGTSF